MCGSRRTVGWKLSSAEARFSGLRKGRRLAPFFVVLGWGGARDIPRAFAICRWGSVGRLSRGTALAGSVWVMGPFGQSWWVTFGAVVPQGDGIGVFYSVVIASSCEAIPIQILFRGHCEPLRSNPHPAGHEPGDCFARTRNDRVFCDQTHTRRSNQAIFDHRNPYALALRPTLWVVINFEKVIL